MQSKKLIATAALVLGLATAASAPAAAAELLVNGGFETPVQVSPNFATFNIPAGSNYITGWTVVQGNVDLTTTANYGPLINTLDPTSKQDVDLIGDASGSGGVFGGLSQSFATTAGQQYTLTFDYSHNNGTFSALGYAAQVTVADGNAPLNSIFSTTVSQAYGAAPWTLFSQTFTAASNLTLLKFIDTQGAFNAGIYLDDVSVTPLAAAAVPEPITLSLFGAGLAGAFALRRKKKAA